LENFNLKKNRKTPSTNSVKDGISEERKYGIIDRNYTLFWSNVLRRRGMYLAMVERRLQWRGKDVGAENDLLNDLGFCKGTSRGTLSHY